MDQANLKVCPAENENPGGFTLIETIITLVVLSIAAVAVLSVFTVGMQGSANAPLTDQAVQLAQEKMDTIMGDKLNSNAGWGFSHIIPGNYPAENPVPGFPSFNRSVSIYCADAGTLNTDNGVPPGAGGCASGYTHVTVTVANATIGNVTVEGLVTNY